MERSAKRTFARVGMIWLAGFVLAGCAVKGVHLNEMGTANVEVLPSEDRVVSIERADVYQDGGELILKGTARKNGPIFSTYEGHIDVALMDATGQTIGLGTATYRHIPSRRRYSPFEVRFSVVAEPGTLVRLLFHPLDHSDHKHLAAMDRLKAERTPGQR
ncbi:MAG: hypothetical protein AB9873_14695 [Syntrophobacteraceae bacterium]